MPLPDAKSLLRTGFWPPNPPLLWLPDPTSTPRLDAATISSTPPRRIGKQWQSNGEALGPEIPSPDPNQTRANAEATPPRPLPSPSLGEQRGASQPPACLPLFSLPVTISVSADTTRSTTLATLPEHLTHPARPAQAGPPIPPALGAGRWVEELLLTFKERGGGVG